jgi:predicted ABC-type ATPase
MSIAATPKPRAARTHKLDLDAELRLIRAVKARMMAAGEAITAETLRQRGYSAPFIKKFFSLCNEPFLSFRTQ